MKRHIATAAFFCLLVFTLQAQTVYTPDNLPKVHLQDETRYVCNPDNVLSTTACDSIDSMLHALENQTGIETVVAVVNSIGEADCFDFCHQLLNDWGVGKKEKDNGLVILLVTDQRCIQFYTGYGLEGDLPDAICKRIQTTTMVPYFKDARWEEGMVAGIKSVCARLEGSMENDTSDEDEEFIAFMATFIFIFLLLIVIAIVAARQATKCPHCGKHKLQRTSSILLSNENGVKTEEITYICQHCGHVVKRQQRSGDDHYRGGGGHGPVIFGGGGFGGGGFGGGVRGGSFGGGRGGGGGAGTRF